MSKLVKCLVWDLDNTIWKGTLAESDSCRLRPAIRSVLAELDSRGILMSIASSNDYESAVSRLKRHHIWEYFIHPEIGWQNKIHSLKAIARQLDIELNTLAFIDDEPYELSQVQMLLPEVRTYGARAYRALPTLPEFSPVYITTESRRRRAMYVGAEARTRSQLATGGNRLDFLRWTQTKLGLREAREHDIPRIMELLNRTSQLNATGIVYSADEIREFIGIPEYRVYVASLQDRFVDYGNIGVAICRIYPEAWRLISFLLSCRVLSRGISGIFLNWVRRTASQHGVDTVEMCYKRSPRNRKMHLLLRMNGFIKIREDEQGVSVFSQSRPVHMDDPDWLQVDSEIGNETVQSPAC